MHSLRLGAFRALLEFLNKHQVFEVLTFDFNYGTIYLIKHKDKGFEHNYLC